MEEDEDSFLFSSLGVTSANPADIEQTILEEVLLHIIVYVNCYFLLHCCSMIEFRLSRGF